MPDRAPRAVPELPDRETLRTSGAVFLDRDGVLIENVDTYVRSTDDVVPIDGSAEALAALHAAGIVVVIVSNQSMVGRGLVPAERAEAIHRSVVETMTTEHPGAVRASYLCLHAPEDGCRCRKPAPGLLEQAAEDLDIDLRASVVVGDAITDVEAARSAGSAAILVATGRGTDLRPPGPADGWVDALDLADATRQLLGEPTS